MLLMTIGAVLLGANVGLLPGDAPHALLHLSPAILILIGIELLLGREAPTAALVLESVVVALSVVLALSLGPAYPRDIRAAHWE